MGTRMHAEARQHKEQRPGVKGKTGHRESLPAITATLSATVLYLLDRVVEWQFLATRTVIIFALPPQILRPCHALPACHTAVTHRIARVTLP